jgi:hypothetical protein
MSIAGGRIDMRVNWLLALGFAVAFASDGQSPVMRERDAFLSSLPVWAGEKSYSGRPSAYRIPNDDSFVFVYPGESGRGLTIVPFRLRNRSDPAVAVEIGLLPDNRGFVYSYRVSNGSAAPEPIWGWDIVDPANDTGASLGESAWRGFRAAGAGLRPTMSLGFADAAPGVLILWRDFESRLSPGQSRGPFRIESNFLPGLTTASFTSGTFFAFPDEPPAELDSDMEKLNKREVAQQIRLTMGPRYPPSVSPGKWAELLARDLRAAYDVMPGFRRSAYIQQALHLLDSCAVAANCTLRGNMGLKAETPVEQDIQRGIGAASDWFSRTK